MNNGETVAVSVAGEDLNLPLSMTVLRQLGRAQVCPIYLSGMAAIERRPLVLDLYQSCTALAIGMNAAGLPNATPDAVWHAARVRDNGCAQVNAVALEYLMAFVSAMPANDTPAPAAGGVGEAPKA